MNLNTYVGKPQTIKVINRNIIFSLILSNPGISQVEISDRTGLSLSTVNKVVRQLESDGTVMCVGRSSYTGGRRAKIYRVNEDSGYIVAVYIQEQQFYCKVTNIIGKEVTSGVFTLESSLSWSQNLIKNLGRITSDIDIDRVEIIGVAVPGTVTKDRIHNIPAIPEWEGVCLKDVVSEHYSCQVLIENDIKAAAMGACGRYIDENNQNMVYISILSHIGSAIIINGALYNSEKSFAGELAYMAVDNCEEPTGQLGCADMVLSDALEAGDRSALIALVAKLVVNTTCVIDPDLIVIATTHCVVEDNCLLRKCVSRYIAADYIPKIVIDCLDVDKNLDGIVSICRSRIEAAIKIVET